MNTQKDAYGRVVGMLKNNNPELRDKERFVDQIMKRVRQGDGAKPHMETRGRSFSTGTVNTWFRAAMTAAALFLLGLFLLQQLRVSYRLNALEKQLVHSVYPSSNGVSEPGILSKSLADIFTTKSMTGDIRQVSGSDLESLFDSYMKLMYRFESLSHVFEQESRMEILLREHAGKNHGNNRSM